MQITVYNLGKMKIMQKRSKKGCESQVKVMQKWNMNCSSKNEAKSVKVMRKWCKKDAKVMNQMMQNRKRCESEFKNGKERNVKIKQKITQKRSRKDSENYANIQSAKLNFPNSSTHKKSPIQEKDSKRMFSRNIIVLFPSKNMWVLIAPHMYTKYYKHVTTIL